MTSMRDRAAHLLAGVRGRWRALPSSVRTAAGYGGVLLVGVWLGGGLVGGEDGAREGRWEGLVPVAESVDDHDHTGEPTEWTCSMHPHVRQAEPGSCPICGMDLIPVPREEETGEAGDLPRLSVSERAAALMSVQVWPAERRPAEGEVRLYGTVAYDETLLHDVALRAEGQIEELHVAYENAVVRRGDALAEVYSPQVHAASQELLQARRAAAAGGRVELVGAAASQLVALGVSQAQVDSLLTAGEPLRTFTVFSPADGVVTELAARKGEWMGAGTRLLRVAGNATVWAGMEAYEADLVSVRVGAPVEITVDALAGRRFAGTVSFISPTVDAARRTAWVRAQVPNPDGALKPGMLLRGRVGVGAGSAALVVPATAPLLTGRRALVYVRLRDADRPTFEAREVTLGSRRGAWWEVTGGLEEGALVVVNGAFRIDAELQIRGRPSLMAPGGDGAPSGSGGHAHTAGGQQGGQSGRAGAEAAGPTLSDAGGREMARIVQAYLDLARAVSRDDAGAARAAARSLESALDGATLGGLTGDAGEAWRSARGALAAHAAAMTRAPDLATQRKDLRALSERMERAVRAFPSDQVGPLYRAFCPMVEGGGGTWLTREPKVENPYWGAAMFECGEIQGKVAG